MSFLFSHYGRFGNKNAHLFLTYLFDTGHHIVKIYWLDLMTRNNNEIRRRIEVVQEG